MAQITFRWTGDGIARLEAAMNKLEGPRKMAALRRALNHTGDKVFTRVKRELQTQIGAPQSVIVRYGKVRKVRASNAAMQYLIIAKGGPIPLKHFGARQGATGVSAAPWHNRKLYKSAFVVGSLGGHAFWRKGKERLPIERIAGPNVPKEMVKDQVAAAFQAVTASSLPARVEHEVRVLTNGVVS